MVNTVGGDAEGPKTFSERYVEIIMSFRHFGFVSLTTMSFYEVL